MALFKQAYTILKTLEYSNSSNILHKNGNEKNITCYGIYRHAHPRWTGWSIVDMYIRNHRGNLRKASRALSKDLKLEKQVQDFYIHKFWRNYKLHAIKHQHIANEIFIFGVNNNTRRAIRIAQRAVGVKADGYIGRNTLRAFANTDVTDFSTLFDEGEILYYSKLIKRNPRRYLRYLSGWVKRAFKV